MRQGPRYLAFGAALALAAAVTAAAPAAMAAPKTAAPAVKAAKSRNGLRQFTGYVTALDKATLTVERRGKSSLAMVFTKHDAMKTTGDLEKNARVTVYYRDEGGHAIAHRVVVKPDRRTSAVK
ncbi:MAG TPA: hypothetical protein VGK93_00785 [Candidatus Eisenbacteria bacterium]|jgi:hypothetical protein